MMKILGGDRYEDDKKAYEVELNGMGLFDLLREFFSFLDYTEESESGRVFHPIVVSSCRCMMTEPVGMVLQRLRKQVEHHSNHETTEI